MEGGIDVGECHRMWRVEYYFWCPDGEELMRALVDLAEARGWQCGGVVREEVEA